MTDTKTEVQVTLKPCPFCGENLSEPTPVQHPKSGLAYLHPGSVTDDDCPLSGWGFYDHQLAAWNTRLSQPEQPRPSQEVVWRHNGGEYLLVKRGLYYRPKNTGYTALKREAGRYPKSWENSDAGVSAVHESEAAEFSPACWDETKLAEREREIAELRAALSTPEHPVTPETARGDVVEARKAALLEAAELCRAQRSGDSDMSARAGHEDAAITACVTAILSRAASHPDSATTGEAS